MSKAGKSFVLVLVFIVAFAGIGIGIVSVYRFGLLRLAPPTRHA